MRLIVMMFVLIAVMDTMASPTLRPRQAAPPGQPAKLPPPGTRGIGILVVETPGEPGKTNGAEAAKAPGTAITQQAPPDGDKSAAGGGRGAAQAGGKAAGKAAGGGAGAGDINLTVLNFALTLENLEAQFYQDALAIFPLQAMEKAGLSSFQANAVIQQMQRQLADEQSHVQLLQAAIKAAGGTPFSGCQFNFRSILTDPITFLASARSLEAVGVSAYMGAASMITNNAVLSAAATILPVEARHSTLLNIFSGGAASPNAFDLPLTPPQVLAVVGGLLQDCQASDLGLTANQPLSVIDGVTQSTLFTTGSILQFQTSAQVQNLEANSLSCQMLVGGATTALVMPASSCIIPATTSGGPINGLVAIFLTSNAQPLTTSLKDQPQNVVAGPALIFVDSNQQEVLSQVFTVKGLNLKSLPTANLASAALTPQAAASNSTSRPGAKQNGRPEERGKTSARNVDTSKKARDVTNDTGSPRKLIKSNVDDVAQEQDDNHPQLALLGSTGLNQDLLNVSWAAAPKAVIQNPSQLP